MSTSFSQASQEEPNQENIIEFNDALLMNSPHTETQIIDGNTHPSLYWTHTKYHIQKLMLATPPALWALELCGGVSGFHEADWLEVNKHL